MNQSRRIVVVAVSALAGASLLAMSGCAGSHLSRFRSNPTPELSSLGMRQAEVDNRTTIVFDHNKRAMYDDLRRMFLTDRPSRLTAQPTMY